MADQNRDVKLRVELEIVQTGGASAPGGGAAQANPVLPSAPQAPPSVTGATVPGAPGSPGPVGLPGASGGLGSPGAPGQGMAPVPAPPAQVPPPAAPRQPSAPRGAPSATVAPPKSWLDVTKQAAERAAEARVVGMLSPQGSGTVKALVQAGALRGSGAVGALGVGAVAAAAVVVAGLAAEKYGPGLAASFGGQGDAMESFARFTSKYRGKLSAALDIGQDFEAHLQAQANVYGKADLEAAKRYAFNEYQINSQLKALERNRGIYESERLGASMSPAEFVFVKAFSGMSSIVGR